MRLRCVPRSYVVPQTGSCLFCSKIWDVFLQKTEKLSHLKVDCDLHAEDISHKGRNYIARV